MKFRNGMWLFREDIRAEFAEDIASITPSTEGDALTILCPTRQIHNRGNTLNQPTVTIDLRAEFDDVISITAVHWKGAQNPGPHYPLFPDGKPSSGGNVNISATDAGTTLTSGKLSAVVTGEPHTFSIRFEDVSTGEAVTSLDSRSVGFAYSPAPSSPYQLTDMSKFKHYMFTQHALGVGEGIYGLGERFTAFNKIGQQVTLYNSDGGTSSEQAYKNIPFYLSSAGYGVFIDHPEPVDLEIGSERTCRLQKSVEGQRLKWYLIYGPNPKEVLRKYCILTGMPAKLPSWSYGLWLSTSFTTDYDEATVGKFLDGMKERDIPVHVFHYDCFWLRAFHWCDFVFSKDYFPDPKAMMTRLKEKFPGIKFCVWINPYLGDASPVFAEAKEKGYLLKRTNGDVWQWDLWQAGMGLVDVTNPAAREWYTEKLNYLFDVGVDCLKTDFGERIPDADVQWHDSTLSPAKMHNFYAYTYNELVFRALEARFGVHNAVLFARAATAGTQRFPLQWGGDCESTFEAMAESLRGGLSLGLSGYSYWSVDIGGFEGTPSPAIYKRWVQFGLLCSHSRLHGSNSYRVPWTVDEESSDVLRTFTQLKCRLMPYLYSLSTAATTSGTPVSLRAMLLEFPEDPTSWYLDRQYMLGDSLLVAPVFTASGKVTLDVVVYGEDGSILVLGKEGEKRVVYDYCRDVEVRCYSPLDSKDVVGDVEGGEKEQWRSVNIVDQNGEAKGTIEVVDGKVRVPDCIGGEWTVTVDGKLRASWADQPSAKDRKWVVDVS